MNKWKRGNVVYLKSGGPPMTVKSVDEAEDEDDVAVVEVEWFEQIEGEWRVKEGSFYEEQLASVEGIQPYVSLPT